MKAKQTLFAGLIFAVLLALTLCDRLREETADLEEYAERAVTGLALEDLQKLTLDNRHGHFEVERREGGWWLTSPMESRASQFVFVMLSNLSDAKRHSEIENVPTEDLADYGLQIPETVATLTTGDGSQITLLIGDEAPSLNRYFATIEGSGDVFTVSGHVAGNLDKSLEQLRDHRLFPNTTFEQITSAIAITAEGTQFIITPDEDGNLHISGHENHLADASVALGAVQAIQRMEAKSFIDAPLSPSMGLDPAPFSVALRSGSEEVVGIDIGLPTSQLLDEFYARVRGRDGIFTVDRSVLSAIPTNWMNWIDRDLFHLSANEVTSFSLVLPTNASESLLSFAKDDDGRWKSTMQPNAQIDQSAIANLLGLFDRLRSEGVVAIEPETLANYGLDEPWVVFTWRGTPADGDEEVVERIDLGSSVSGTVEAHYRRNGEPVVHRATSMLGEILEMRNRLIDRRLVTVNLGQTDQIIYGLGDASVTVRRTPSGWERVMASGETEPVSLQSVETVLISLNAVEYDSTVTGQAAEMIRNRLTQSAPWQITLVDDAGEIMAEVSTTQIPSMGESDERIIVLLDGDRVCEIENRATLIALQSALRGMISR